MTKNEAHFLYSYFDHGPRTGLLCGEQLLRQPRTYRSARGFFACPTDRQCADCRRILDQVLCNRDYQALAQEVAHAAFELRALLTRVSYGEREGHSLVPASHMHQAITKLQAVLRELETMWRPTIDAELIEQDQVLRFALPQLREATS